MRGMNPYFRLMYTEQGFHPLSANNITASTDTRTGSDTPTLYDYDIIYNNDNYPVRIARSYHESHALITVLEFEYL